MSKPPAEPGPAKRARPAARKGAAARREPAAPAAGQADPAPSEPSPPSAASMLQSSLQALAQARKHAESGPAKVVASLIDPFGFRKLEDVFDQRVASAMDRLGLPAPAVLIALVREIEDLRKRVEQLEKARR